MSEQLTGAQSLIRSLEQAGVDTVFGIPGGAILPAYDPLFDSAADPAHPGPPRAGRGPRRHGLRPGHRPGGGVHGHQRSGGDEPGDPDRRRAHGLGADGRDHRSGPQQGDRDRRLPGGRHPRHHDADHQAQLPPHRPGRHPAHHRRGLPHRRHRSAGAGPGRRRQGRAAGHDHLHLAPAPGPARLSARRPPARQAGPRGRPPARGCQAPRPLRRRRRAQGACCPGAAGAGRARPAPRS